MLSSTGEPWRILQEHMCDYIIQNVVFDNLEGNIAVESIYHIDFYAIFTEKGMH